MNVCDKLEIPIEIFPETSTFISLIRDNALQANLSPLLADFNHC